MAASGEQHISKEPSAEQDERILKAIRDDFHETVVYKTDLKSLLPILVKSGYVSESRQRTLTKKAESDASATFQALLTRTKSQTLRRGFLLALKESAMSVPSHNMLLSSLTKAAGVDMKSLEEEHVVRTAHVVTEPPTPSLPPFKYHYSLNDNPSAIFSSTGGVLYSPVYGVMVYIPAGAILEEDQVEVSFRVVTEETEIHKFLSLVMLEGSVLCSAVLEFEAKLASSLNRTKFDIVNFHSDVWIELPHCLSFIGGSLRDYSTAMVVSERRGKVKVETQALFSEGYPYVNLPVRHFSKFSVQQVQQRFTWPAKHHQGKLLNASKHSVYKLASDLRQLSLSNSYKSGDSPTLVESPSAQSRHIRHAVIRSSSLTSYSPPGRQALLAEVRSVTSRSFEQPARLELVHQQSVDLTDEDTMDIDTPGVQDQNDCHSSLDQELLHGTSMSLYACVYQPMNRHTCAEWTADIVFIPLLPQALIVLMLSGRPESECRPLSFELKPGQMRSLSLRSKPPSDLRGWTVELDRMEILLEEFNVQLALLSQRSLTKTDASLLREDTCSSKVATFFPKAVARVHNRGAPLPLMYPIEVHRSSPLTQCFLTCKTRAGDEEDQQSGSQHKKRRHYTPENGTKENSLSPSPAKRERVDTDILWAHDRYIFVLLSILLPANMLSDVAKKVGLDELRLKHVQGIPLQCGVGERMYNLLKLAVSERCLTSFAQLQACLSTLQSCQRLVSNVDSYLTFKSSLDVSLAGDSHGDGGYQLQTPFLGWAVNQLNHSMPITPNQDGSLIIAKDDQMKVFLSLCKQLCSVWRMAARLLGLKDSDIDELVTKYLVDGPCECSYQMLCKWAGSCPNPSDVSYTRLHLVLSIIAHGTCAADAAFTFVQGRITNLSRS